MTINIKNFLNDKTKMSKMGEFQNLKQIEGLEMASTSADLYGNGRDDLALFYFKDGANYATVSTTNSITSESITWNNSSHKKLIKGLLENTKNLREIFGEEYKKIAKEQIELIMVISNHITAINALVNQMVDERKKANKFNGLKSAELYCKNVKPFFAQIRYHCDKLETMVDDNLWPLTKYRELLFTR